jgi:hypothetical protein
MPAPLHTILRMRLHWQSPTSTIFKRGSCNTIGLSTHGHGPGHASILSTVNGLSIIRIKSMPNRQSCQQSVLGLYCMSGTKRTETNHSSYLYTFCHFGQATTTTTTTQCPASTISRYIHFQWEDVFYPLILLYWVWS